MGYQAVKEGISKMLKAKGFIESKAVFDFEQETDQSINKKFLIQRPNISLDGEGTEYLATLVRPNFGYKLMLGFKLAEQTPVLDYDVSQILIDVLIAYFNNPVNYTGFCVRMKTKTVETREVDEHLEIEIALEVIDDITLT